METSPSEKLNKFFNSSRVLSYKKGDVVLRFQDNPQGVLFIRRGYVKDSALSPNGQEFTLFIFKPDDVFPYSWAFNEIQNEHSFTAMTDCEILRRPKVDFLAFMEENQDVLFMLTRRILVRLRGLLQRMEYLVFGNARQKIISIFLILTERFGSKGGDQVKIQIPLSHKDIADLVGLTRETASIEIKRLSEEGYLTRMSKYYTVKRLKKLQRESLLGTHS